jgi:hypothetical protein
LLQDVDFTLPPGQEIGWIAQDGSQCAFLQSSLFEVLYEGTRGPGKTDALLMDFAQHCGLGYGAEWRGILFRQTYPQLDDIINKSLKWFPRLFTGIQYNKVEHTWTWPTGEKLMFRHMKDPSGYWSYHGHAYPWIGWEELTNWANDRCYKIMMSCCRSTFPGMPRKYRSTTNPYGVGHNWVKARWRLPSHRNRIIRDSLGEDGKLEPARASFFGSIYENQILLNADPEYIGRIRAAAENTAMLAAWLDGSWDIVAGGMFDDLWSPSVHVVDPFPIPSSWRISRSFDWGSARPFSVGWWAISDGSDVATPRGIRSTVRGDVFRVHEWYGWNKKPNEGLKMLAADVAAGIVERELKLGYYGRVRPGPADSAIFSTENGTSISGDMLKKVRVNGKEYPGIAWQPADKSPGSRKAGWQNLRAFLKHSVRPSKGVREHPGLFVFGAGHCDQFLRTFPVLPRDDKDLDDVDTDAEDHIGDEVRYFVHNAPRSVKSGLL